MTPLIIFGAKYLFIAVALAAAAVIFFDKERRMRIGLVALVSLPLAYALARLAGMFYSHAQPFAVQGFEPLVPHEIDNSFPSDHTLVAGVFASAAFLSDRRLGLFLWAFALLVGLSRMLAGLHWGVDVLASAALAAGVVWIVNSLATNYFRA
jgi:undecaprenyl-diphosphatase